MLGAFGPIVFERLPDSHGNVLVPWCAANVRVTLRCNDEKLFVSANEEIWKASNFRLLKLALIFVAHDHMLHVKVK